MLRKNYFTFLIVVALFLAGSVAAFAQGGTVKGKVQLKKASGALEPVEGANIEIYRVDAVSGKLTPTTTNAKGEFTFTDVPSGQLFAILTTAPNLKPEVTTEVKAGSVLAITVSPGGGEVPSEADVREAIAQSKNPISPEELKKREKLAAEVNAKNEKVKNINQVVNTAMSEGKTAFEAKNYDLAIVKYTEGINADPEYAGTAPVFLNNKGTALKLRGFESYKKSSTDTANKQTLMESAKKDFQEAIISFQKSLAILKTATTTDAKLQKSYEANRNAALRELVETYRLMVGSRADQTMGKEAATVATDYAAGETDPAQKTKTLVILADTLRLAGDSANAVPVYRIAMTGAPENPDILAGLGLSLFSAGAEKSPADKALMQEGLDLMTRFAEVAPETHPLKADVKGAVEYIKTTEKLTPQKTTRPAASKKKT
jgi:tetratricopeptide (TPR) repeat protein